MKELIWKELREQAFIPPLCAILLALQVTYNKATGAWAGDGAYVAVTVQAAMYLWVLAGVLATAVSFSRENGNRTLTFLTVLPLPRAHIWRAKVLAGMATIGITIAWTSAAWAMAFRVLFGTGRNFVTEMVVAQLRIQPYFSDWFPNDFHYYGRALISFPAAVLTALACYSVALMVAPLIDRAVIAVVAVIAACWALVAAGAQMLSTVPWVAGLPGFGGAYTEEYLGALLFVVYVPMFLAASFSIFRSGEVLRVTPRLAAELRVLMSWVVMGLLVAGAGMGLWHH